MIALTLVMSRASQSPWHRTRAELLVALDSMGIPVHPKWSLPELRQTLIEHRQQVLGEPEDKKLVGLGRMSHAGLKEKCEENHISLPAKATRGLMLKLLREALQPAGDQVMTFGRYKSWMFKEVPKEYAE